MNLAEGIKKYVGEKQAFGLDYTQVARRFRRFSRHMGNVEIAQITTKDVSSFLGLPTANSATWDADYLLLRRFLDYWTIRGEIPALPMPPRPVRSLRSSRSYVYSAIEIRKLLNGTIQCQARANCIIDAETLRMYLIFLYATGVTVCESLDLKRGDMNLRKKSIAVYNRKYGWSRQVPIGSDLTYLLSAFLRRKSVARRKNDALFTDKNGRFIEPSQITYCFRRLRRLAGVAQKDRPALQPRLLDFRITFAVHRIRSWIKDDVALNRMLPALAVYLGQSSFGPIDRYMDLTPERFKSHLAILSPKQRVKRWTDDPELMNFLGSV